MGCCGSRNRSVAYQVTFRDGSTELFETNLAARVAAAQDPSEGPKAPMVRAVAKPKQ